MFRAAYQELTATKHAGVIPWLDFLRVIAVLLVIGGHTLEYGYTGAPFRAFYWGWTGVDLFFILSGYLIGMQLWKELRRDGDINFGRFFLRRTLRIWPLYFAVAAAYGLWDLAHHHTLAGLQSDVLFISNYFHHQVSGGWSLSTEEQFYLISPVLLILFRRAPLKRLVWISITWLSLLPVVRWWTLAHHAGQAAKDVMYFPIHLHSDGLALGILIALVATVWPRLLQDRKLAVRIAIGMFALGLLARLSGAVILFYTALALIYGAMAIGGLTSTTANRVTNWRIFHVISRLSFGMYLIHQPLVQLFKPYVTAVVAKHPSNLVIAMLAFALIAASSMAVSFVTFSAIELPFLHLRDRMTESRKRVRVLQPATVPAAA